MWDICGKQPKGKARIKYLSEAVWDDFGIYDISGLSIFHKQTTDKVDKYVNMTFTF